MSALATYLRSHRLKSGFSRRELAEIVGFLTKLQVSRHERSDVLPSLMAALAYQAIFRISVSELFPGLYETVAEGIEDRLVDLEQTLQERTAQGHEAQIIATKLVWLNERKGSAVSDPKA